jgi:hypothetical protein
VRRYFFMELCAIGLLAGLLTAIAPRHLTAVIVAIVLAWIALQAVSAWHFMSALYQGDVIESGPRPHRYTPAAHATLNWYTRRFMLCYLNAPTEAVWPRRLAKPAISGGRDRSG